MSYRRLPPLNAIRAFEAAARHLSLTRAASELNVTPGAVSRQIRELEAHLGRAVFERRHDGVVLTAGGEALFAAARAGLDAIAAGALEAERAGAAAPLRVGAYATFATRWLIPRWTRFCERHPELELQLTTTSEALDLTPQRFDAVIMVGDGKFAPGVAGRKLVPIEVTPVCSPRLLRRGRAPDLTKQRLLHARPRPRDWERWLAAAGIAGIDPRAGIVFDNMNQAVDAAAEGLGVALAIRALVTRDLEEGRLAAPFAVSRSSSRCFVLAYEAAREHDARIAAFRDWLAEEIGAAPALTSPPAGAG